MKTEELLEFAESIVTRQTGKAKTELQINIFHGVLQGKTYEQIAQDCPCNLSTAKNVGSEWCEILSKALGEIVGKRNVVRVLEKKLLTQNSSISPTNTPSKSNKNPRDNDLIKTQFRSDMGKSE
ncbi:MAG: hypothetical protein F6K22_02705 [Okeania sp. SIO2F4]|uniref:hypothetical protein n=1 Tax=Okeania sp. SIO2F4 TaxID=2607790 RepID=UPI00142A7161|nr:hypothetical protein [Okeania sp. SIO2F4]NES01832.1 hypothetical protein [Okeania sp. SIO2F4]